MLATAIVLASPVFVERDAEARPGGGQGYTAPSRSGGSSSPSSGGRSSGSSSRSSGGSSSPSSSSGSSDSGGGVVGEILAGILIELVFRHPKIGVPLLLGVALLFVLRSAWSGLYDWHSTRQAKAWREQAEAPPTPEPARGLVEMAADGRAALERIRVHDPDFSTIVFTDFLHHLYVRVHEARGAAELRTLSAYVTEAARRDLETDELTGVEGVVVGSATIVRVEDTDDGHTAVTVRFEGNRTEVGLDEVKRAKWTSELWTLRRSRDARSQPPERIRVLGCPECGAPSADALADRCRACGAALHPGERAWGLSMVVFGEEQDAPPALLTHTEEQGNDLPTVVSPGADDRLAAIRARDAAFDPRQLEGRLRRVFLEMNDAWSSLDWVAARPYLADTLWQSQRYWIEAYRASGLRNVVQAAEVKRLELADARSDAYYDAVTYRVFAEALDYTIDSGERVVSGSSSKRRAYTEYWTLVRSARASGPVREEKTCGNCGATLEIEQAGTCRYCRVHVTSGEFDWVLARIEQDDSYVG